MKFGTDGVRGPAGSPPIDEDGAERIGHAAARWALAVGDGRVVVAHDPRPSGARLAQAVCEGVRRTGARACSAGLTSSPALSVATRDLADVGVMVTASHNHAADNGFKVLGPGGLKPDDAQTRRLEGWATSYARGGLEGALDDVSASATAQYREAFEDAVGLLALRGKRLAIDLAHGGASVHRDWLAAKLAPLCEVTWLGQGEGVINEGVGSEHPEALGTCVRRHGLDAGLAVDGDGDRCLLVNERGEVVPGDALAWLLTKQMQLPALAVTVMSNAALEASLPGVEVIRTPVGDRHLSMAMRSRGIGLGMEDSGHALFGDGLPGGDGLLTGLRALSAAWVVAESLSEAFGGFQPFPRRLTKVRVARRPDLHTDPELVEIQRAAEERLGSGRVFLRYSGTEPVLRILVEGPDPGRVDQVSDALTRRCAEVLG